MKQFEETKFGDILRLGDSNKTLLIEKHPEIWLVTYRKNGTRVKTPMWFIIKNNHIYMITNKTSIKVKYILHNPHVEIWLSETENPNTCFHGVARLIFTHDNRFSILARALWEKHPTFYGPFEERFKLWLDKAVIIEITLLDE